MSLTCVNLSLCFRVRPVCGSATRSFSLANLVTLCINDEYKQTCSISVQKGMMTEQDLGIAPEAAKKAQDRLAVFREQLTLLREKINQGEKAIEENMGAGAMTLLRNALEELQLELPTEISAVGFERIGEWSVSRNELLKTTTRVDGDKVVITRAVAPKTNNPGQEQWADAGIVEIDANGVLKANNVMIKANFAGSMTVGSLVQSQNEGLALQAVMRRRHDGTKGEYIVNTVDLAANFDGKSPNVRLQGKSTLELKS